MISIMFVCSGNICRSPMAHYYMQKRLYELGIQDKYCIISSGTQAYPGQKATDDAIYTISKYGVNLVNHRATSIQDINIQEVEYIICMTRMHYDYVINNYPNLRDKVYILKEMVLENKEYLDIDDPWGLDLEVYSGCAKEIVEAVDKLILKLESGDKI